MLIANPFHIINNATDRAEYKRINNPENIRLVDTANAILKTGDVVLRTGADVTSYMFSQMNHQDKTFSHCGIVIVEHGYPFVYHAIGGEDNPDEALRRDSIKFWLSPDNNLGYGIVRFPFTNTAIQSLTKEVYKFYNEKVRFDMKFDLKTDDRLYCAEFCYKAINHAMNDSQYLKPITVLGYRYIGVDNIYLNNHAKLIWKVRYK